MDKVKIYQDYIKQLLKDHADFNPNYDEFETQVLADDDQGYYYLMRIGWNDDKRIHSCLLHLDIKEDKIWIQYDGTEEGAANELINKGVPKSDIVLGYRAPFERELLASA